MAPWRFLITPEAENDLGRLDASVRARVVEKLKWLISNFEEITPIPLGNSLRGFFKLRIGTWRVIYETDTTVTTVVVHAIGPRDKIYKKKK